MILSLWEHRQVEWKRCRYLCVTFLWIYLRQSLWCSTSRLSHAVCCRAYSIVQDACQHFTRKMAWKSNTDIFILPHPINIYSLKGELCSLCVDLKRTGIGPRLIRCFALPP